MRGCSPFCQHLLYRNLVQKNGKWLKEGDILRNPEFAKTLRIIREDPEDFYVGNLAKSIVDDVNTEGGTQLQSVTIDISGQDDNLQ